MGLNCASVICYSPTGTTRKVLESILVGLGITNCRFTDPTDAGVRANLELIVHEDTTLAGVPV